MAVTGKNRIMIRPEGRWHLRRRVHAGAGANPGHLIPGSEAAVLRNFQERMPYGLFVPELGADAS